MAHFEQQQFCINIKNRYPEFFKNKKVLDLGSLDINGSNREYFENCEYIGLDVGEGKNVDVIGLANEYDAPDSFFDTVISTEMLEHDMFYEESITNSIRMLKNGGALIFTCAAPPRAEHGTRRSDGSNAAPLLIQRSEEWSDYYKNLIEEDIRKINGFNEAFPDGEFIHDKHRGDLYFFGIKGGIKKWKELNRLPSPTFKGFNEDIFVIDTWPDTQKKRETLVSCITKLKEFDIPILLVSHFPIDPDLQKMVDYYIFDKDNPIVAREDYQKYLIDDLRWSQHNDWKFTAEHEFHHDFAIWKSFQNAFNFCNFLGKKYIHFIEYDCLVEPLQYKQSFIDMVRNYDMVVWEYHEGSVNHGADYGEYCATFIFSIKTQIAVDAVSQINSLGEYFINRPHGWQLERSLIREVRKITQNIAVSPYIDNEYTLNTHAVWNRDGIIREDAFFQIYKAVDEIGNLYLHTISGFHEKEANKDYLIEIRYDSIVRLETIKKGQFAVFKLGKYKKGNWIKVLYKGIIVFEDFLYLGPEKDSIFGKIVFEENIKPQIKVDYLNGCRVAIGNGFSERLYKVEIIDLKNNSTIYATELSPNHWAAATPKYFVNWKVQVKDEFDKIFFSETFDLTNKNVIVSLESQSIGDTIAWVPVVAEFAVKMQCNVMLSTFHNELFLEYPNIKWILPGTVVPNVYATYRIGVWYENNKYDNSFHPSNPFKTSLQGIAAEILGIEFNEKRPNLSFIPGEPEIKGKYICIAPHSTAQAKYWNYPGGWQKIIDYYTELGYKVVYSSNEDPNDPAMIARTGKLTGFIDRSGLPLEKVMNDIANCSVFIGISSGLSWIAWALNSSIVLISGFTNQDLEFKDCRRIINKNVCHDCWSRHFFDKGDWNWCPDHKDTDRHFECTKEITPEKVINEIDSALKS